MTWWSWTILVVYLLLGVVYLLLGVLTQVEGVPFLVWLLCKLFWPVLWLYLWYAYSQGKGTFTITTQNKKRTYQK